MGVASLGVAGGHDQGAEGIALQHASLCSNPGYKAELARRYNTKVAAPRKWPVS